MKNKKYLEALESSKELLKGLLNSEASQDVIDKITQIDKSLDEMTCAHEEVENEVSGLKDKMIDMIKGTSFKSPSIDSYGEKEEVKSLDEVLLDCLSDIGGK